MSSREKGKERFPQPSAQYCIIGASHLNIGFFILVLGAVFTILSTILTLTACMLSSRISQTEEFVELLVHAVNQQMTTTLRMDDQVE